ncbi:type II toxin-antitoxin system HicB family antitoxin [Finegoldia magna]|uniref:type II toxin-antitoxin system HicB family antitoxin n=1 Tax=Finegoldia magna TaxID=1260 RepID=UPI002904936C|nr:type II toxin-antitoxin system HicB family antitoxin [Finegoldia magna]MDU2897804.1 type II toxin-antitoxin system HicB family antitoxin [Finegoldia magna]MDU5369738.1 type II toxin-antitoxin system HicB family antitoxin [Finegoldia magna]
MLKSYPAIFHKEEDSYWVEFPEFGGGTEGDNIEEAMVNAHQMLESVLATFIDEDIPLPKPSDITKIKVEDGFTSMIQVDPTLFIKNNKTIRKNVTVPEWLVRLYDRQNINYSEVLTTALEKKINA